MAKLAILSPFNQIARPLEGARTQNCDRSISYGIWGYISRLLFLIQKFLFFTPPHYRKYQICSDFLEITNFF